MIGAASDLSARKLDAAQRVQADLAAMIFGRLGPHVLSASLAAEIALTLAYAFNRWVAAIFGAASFIAYGARFVLIYRYRAVAPPAGANGLWLRLYTAVAIAAGLAWGSAAVLMTTIPDWQANTAVWAVLAACIAMASGCALAHACYMPAADGFIWTTDLLCAAVCLWAAEPGASMAALVFILNAAGSSYIARKMHASIVRTLQTGYANEALAAELAQANGELREAKAIIEDASKAKSAFLASMSHELRTPLNAIIGFSEVMSREVLGPMGTSRYRDYAGDIHASGQHLLGLINDVLDISKIEAGELRLDRETVDLAAVMKGCVRLLSDRAMRAGIQLELSCRTGRPFVYADESRIRQIGFNLLSNAIKFTPASGQVSVAITAEEDGNLILAVSDTGVGMAPEDIPLALTPFKQAESGKNKAREGTGLGLPLTKTLVEAHGGTLRIMSRLGEGTTVIAIFPRSALTAATAA